MAILMMSHTELKNEVLESVVKATSVTQVQEARQNCFHVLGSWGAEPNSNELGHLAEETRKQQRILAAGYCFVAF
jgi:hypothetical protein